MLFNVCLTHGFIPNRCIASVITPVVKSNKNSVRDVDNYRPIALPSIFSKLFELILLKYLESFLRTCDNQFGFNSGHGTRRVARNSQWGGLFWGSGGGAPSRRRPMGVWGRSPQPPEAGGLGAKPPAAGGTEVWGRSPQRSKILHFFCKNNFILGLF